MLWAAFHVELLVWFASDLVWVGFGSVRFSQSFCLFWLLCLQSILPKCGWINFMLFDSLLNFEKQQRTKQQQQIEKNSNKSSSKKCGCQWMKLLLTLNRRARVNEVALSHCLLVCLVLLSQLKSNRAGQDIAKKKRFTNLENGNVEFFF